MKTTYPLLALFAIVLIFLNGCETAANGPASPVVSCDNTDGALDDAAFVIVASPTAGQRVSPGFTVTGCSRTFESTVVWRLVARDGSELAAGNTTGGGVDGHAPFSFTVSYSVTVRQIGHLEVFEEDASDGEGFPPGRSVVPVVLNPGS